MCEKSCQNVKNEHYMPTTRHNFMVPTSEFAELYCHLIRNILLLLMPVMIFLFNFCPCLNNHKWLNCTLFAQFVNESHLCSFYCTHIEILWVWLMASNIHCRKGCLKMLMTTKQFVNIATQSWIIMLKMAFFELIDNSSHLSSNLRQ